MCRSLHSNARSQAVTEPPEFGHYSRRKSCSDARWGPGTGSECTESCDSGSNDDKGCVFLSRYTHLPYAKALWQSSPWSTFSCYNATSDPRWLCVLLRSTSSPFEEATSDVGSKVAVVIQKKSSTIWLTSGPHSGPLGGSFAAGTLYTHIYESTDVHVTYTCKHYQFETAFVTQGRRSPREPQLTILCGHAQVTSAQLHATQPIPNSLG